MDIVCLGEMLVDMFPAELGRRVAEVTAFYPKPGGAPANVAVAAARLGARSAFAGKVGDDAFGRHLANVLTGEGVDTRGVRFDEYARTTLAFIARPDASTAEFVFYRNPGADTRLRPDELDQGLLQGTGALHFASLSLSEEPIRSATREAVQIARAGGALISFDVNFRPSLWQSPDEAAKQVRSILPHVDLLKINEAELALLVPDLPAQPAEGVTDLAQVEEGMAPALASLLTTGPRLCVLTLGSQGSSFRTAEGGGAVPAFPVQAVDSTGCGDAFIAGLLWQLVSRRGSVRGSGGWQPPSPSGLRAALLYANAVGAITAQTIGVIPALPTARQVDEFLCERRIHGE